MTLVSKILRSASTRASNASTRASTVNVAKRALATASDEPLVKTALYDFHKELGGDMVPFAGYELPVLYKGENGGVMKEHLWCREEGKAAMFDVSHMGQVSLIIILIAQKTRTLLYPVYTDGSTGGSTVLLLFENCSYTRTGRLVEHSLERWFSKLSGKSAKNENGWEILDFFFSAHLFKNSIYSYLLSVPMLYNSFHKCLLLFHFSIL